MSDKKRKQKKTQINIKEDKSPQNQNNDNQNGSNDTSSTYNYNNQKQENTTQESTKQDAPSAAQLEFQIDENDNENSGGNKVLGIIAIILGILIMFAGFTAYKYFSDADGTNRASNSEENIASTDATKSNNERTDSTSTETPAIPFFDMDSEGISPVPSDDTYDLTDNSSIKDSNSDYYGFANGGEVIGTSTSYIENNNDEYVEALEETIVTVGENENTLTTNSSEGIISTPDNNNYNTSLNVEPTSTAWVANNYNYGDIQTGEYQVVRGDTLWELAEGAYGNGAQWHKIADANNVSYLSNGNPLIVSGSTILIP